MAQPNFSANVYHLQGIQNQVRKISNMPAIANQNGLQQQMDTNYMKKIAGQDRLEQKLDTTITLLREMQGQLGEMQGQLGEMQGQLGEILNEYVSLSSFG